MIRSLYPENKDEAAQHVRAAIPWISSQGLPANPINYSVVYHFVSERTPELNVAIGAVLEAGELTQDIMDEMYDKYIVGDEAGKLNSLKTAVERLLHDVFTSLKSAGGDIGGFRQYLMGKTSFVKDATDIYQIKDVLSGLIRQSTETQGNMAKLESNLASLSEEMEGVRAEYSRVLQERLLTL